jgi:polyhydroxybutyrate depolymerase
MKTNHVMLFKSFLLSTVCLLIISITSCSQGSWQTPPAGILSAGDWKLSLDQDGKTRTFYLHIPACYKIGTAVPLVISFHGYMDTATAQSDKDGFMQKADEECFIVAYPEGYGTSGFQSWNAGRACCGAAEDNNLDDVGLARDIVSLLAGRCTIDPKRIYAHGHSNGAGMAHRVGREASDVFAAVSPKSMPVLVPDSLPVRPVPVIQFHGSADSTVYYGGGLLPFEEVSYMGAQESFQNWADVNGCSGSPSTVYYGDSRCETYTNCADGVKVTLCTIQGGDHNTLYSRDDILVTDMAWDFMSEFTLP